MPRSSRVLLVALSLVLAACGSSATTGTVEWRGLDVTFPAGWEVFEQRTDLLTASDDDLAPPDEEGATPEIDPDDNDVVGAQFTYEPRTSADDWRALVEGAGGTIELDERIDVGGLPATSLVFSWVTNNVPTRERVVLVPSRELVLLFQPVPVQGQTTGPQVYLEKAAAFDEILASIRFGAPVTP